MPLEELLKKYGYGGAGGGGGGEEDSKEISDEEAGEKEAKKVRTTVLYTIAVKVLSINLDFWSFYSIKRCQRVM